MKMKELMIAHTFDNAFELANKVHSNFNLSQPLDIDLEYICKRYGIKIKELPPEEVSSGMAIPSVRLRKGTIFLNNSLSTLHRREILAEEFCHIYSQHQCQITMDKHNYNKSENFAKKMAAYLLIPDDMFADIEIFEDNEDYIIVSEIASMFNVTEEFAYYRLNLEFKRGLNYSIDFYTTEMFEVKFLYKFNIEYADDVPIEKKLYNKLLHKFKSTKKKTLNE